MSDVRLVGTIVAFFLVAALMVWACNRITADAVIEIVGGLIYLPMLILGPIGERFVG